MFAGICRPGRWDRNAAMLASVTVPPTTKRAPPGCSPRATRPGRTATPTPARTPGARTRNAGPIGCRSGSNTESAGGGGWERVSAGRRRIRAGRVEAVPGDDEAVPDRAAIQRAYHMPIQRDESRGDVVDGTGVESHHHRLAAGPDRRVRGRFTDDRWRCAPDDLVEQQQLRRKHELVGAKPRVREDEPARDRSRRIAAIAEQLGRRQIDQRPRN